MDATSRATSAASEQASQQQLAAQRYAMAERAPVTSGAELASQRRLDAQRDAMATAPHAVVFNVLSVFLPPLAVALKTGDGCESLISLGLFLAGYFPGLIHALVVVNSDSRLNVCTSRLAPAPPPEGVVGGAAQTVPADGSGAGAVTTSTLLPQEAATRSALPEIAAATTSLPTARPFVGTGGILAKDGAEGLPSSPADPVVA